MRFLTWFDLGALDRPCHDAVIMRRQARRSVARKNEARA